MLTLEILHALLHGLPAEHLDPSSPLEGGSLGTSFLEPAWQPFVRGVAASVKQGAHPVASGGWGWAATNKETPYRDNSYNNYKRVPQVPRVSLVPKVSRATQSHRLALANTLHLHTSFHERSSLP